jgi:hypothetical protein
MKQGSASSVNRNDERKIWQENVCSVVNALLKGAQTRSEAQPKVNINLRAKLLPPDAFDNCPHCGVETRPKAALEKGVPPMLCSDRKMEVGTLSNAQKRP